MNYDFYIKSLRYNLIYISIYISMMALLFFSFIFLFSKYIISLFLLFGFFIERQDDAMFFHSDTEKIYSSLSYIYNGLNHDLYSNIYSIIILPISIFFIILLIYFLSLNLNKNVFRRDTILEDKYKKDLDLILSDYNINYEYHKSKSTFVTLLANRIFISPVIFLNLKKYSRTGLIEYKNYILNVIIHELIHKKSYDQIYKLILSSWILLSLFQIISLFFTYLLLSFHFERIEINIFRYPIIIFPIFIFIFISYKSYHYFYETKEDFANSKIENINLSIFLLNSIFILSIIVFFSNISYNKEIILAILFIIYCSQIVYYKIKIKYSIIILLLITIIFIIRKISILSIDPIIIENSKDIDYISIYTNNRYIIYYVFSIITIISYSSINIYRNLRQ